MTTALAVLLKLWHHSRTDVLGWPEKIGMIVIAVLILRVVIYAGIR